MSRPPYEVVSIDDLERIDVAGVHWRPLRRHLGITAFGTNAYTADAGELLIEPHDEAGEDGAVGAEEMYVIVRGSARFTLDGAEHDAAAGTVVFARDPKVRREAVALEDGTVAVAVGGEPGAALPVSAWEHFFYAAPASQTGDFARAYDIAAEALADHPRSASVHFNLACHASRGGEREKAIEHLLTAFEIDPEKVRRWSPDEADLDPIRDDPRFPAL
jgi:tetratricopeptide (TPR) repeat protein